jgi:hypothetical protein
MAIYQYHLTVIPRQRLLRHWNIIPVKIQVHDNPAFDKDDLINVKWWDKENVDFGTIEQKILEFAGQVEWTKKSGDVKTFGNNETNDITIVKGEMGQLDELSFRVSLKEVDRLFIDNVLAIVIDLDCLILDRQGNLFEPTNYNLANSIKKSNAFKFVTNPTDFLNKLGTK